jgi:hypothetical protein
LFQIISYGLYSLGGVPGVTLFFLGLWVAILIIWYRAANLREWHGWAFVLLVMAVLGCRGRFEERPEVFSFLFVVAELCLLERWRERARASGRELAGLVLLEALWATLHTYYFLGLAIVGLWLLTLPLAGRAEFTRLRPVWNRLAFALPVLVLATLASPIGIGTWLNTLGAWGVDGWQKNVIQELHPPTGIALERFWTLWFFWAFLAATAALAALFSLRQRREVFAIALAAVGIFLGATRYRNVPLTFFFAAPLWAAAARLYVPRWAMIRRHSTGAALAASLVALGFAAYAVSGGFVRSGGVPSSFGVGVSELAFPVRLVENHLRQNPPGGRVFSDAQAGSFLEFQLPGLDLFMDSRFSNDAAAAMSAMRAATDPEEFNQWDARLRFEAVLVKPSEGRPLSVALLKDTAWQLAYADLHRAYFTRAGRGAVRPPEFYGGEDLTFMPNLISATAWLSILNEAGRHGLIQEAFRRYARAPRIPTPVLGSSLVYAIKNSDRETARIGMSMLDRHWALSAEDVRMLEEVLRNPALRKLLEP